jgi:hypothetical protein
MGFNYSMYLIYDENGELMRWVKSKAEANYIIKTYTNWAWRYVPKLQPKFDWSKFEVAPF